MKRAAITSWVDEDFWTPHNQVGSAHSVENVEMEQYGGRIAALHAIVEEVTGCPVVVADKGFGFLRRY
jgi:hypothetical protein